MRPDVASAYDATLAGDLDIGQQTLAAIAQEDTPEARAWAWAFGGLLSLGDAAAAPSSDLDLLEAQFGATPDAIGPAARACAHQARRAALAFDVDGVARAERMILGLVSDRAPLESQGWRDVIQGWGRIGRGEDAGALLGACTKAGAESGRADLLLEATALSALNAAEQGDVPTALAIARRCSRMARTEALPQSEFLANLILARVRRLDGKPHLAGLILRALRGLVSAAWLPWLELERVLAEGSASARPEPSAAGLLAAGLQAAWAGDRVTFERELTGARASVRDWAPLLADLAGARALLDPNLALDILPPAFAAWARGTGAPPPRGLIGLAKDAGERAGDLAFVWAPAGGVPRRLLSPGAALVRRGAEPAGAAAPASQLRTDSAIAVLILAGREGLAEAALFKTLYGFEYEPGRHQSVRDTLYQRVKKRAAPAVMEREAGLLRLRHEGPLLVPDPRCTPPAEARILRLLGERRLAGAKDVASELGISVRAAQDALARLAEDGALRKEKVHAGLHYILEDTTFSEPTRRFRARTP